MRISAGLIAIGAIFFTVDGASAQLALGGLDLGFLGGGAGAGAEAGGLPVVGDLGLTFEGNADEDHADGTVGVDGGAGTGGLGGLENLIGTVAPLAAVEQLLAELPPILDAALGLAPPVITAVDTVTNGIFGAIDGIAEEAMTLVTAAVGAAPPIVDAATNLLTTVFGAIDGLATGVLGNIAGP